MSTNHNHSSGCKCGAKPLPVSQAEEDQLDVGAEEFSEQIYDEQARVPAEFDERHNISSTGSDLDNR